MKITYTYLLFFNIVFFTFSASAQDDPEFPRGFIMHAKLHNGAITNFHRGADLYVGGVQVLPQWGIVPQTLRVGFIAGGFYANKRLDAQFGPTLSYKLKTFSAHPFGSAANLHFSADHLWGTNKQKLVGGGIHLDLLNRLLLGITVHKDYEYHTWWLQTAIGFRISKIKKSVEPFNE